MSSSCQVQTLITKQTVKESLGNISGLDKERAIKVFSMEEVLVPAKTIQYLRLEEKEGQEKLPLNRDVILIANHEFQTKKELIMNPIAVVRKDYLVIGIINLYDTMVKVNKGEWVATAVSCDEELQLYLDRARNSQRMNEWKQAISGHEKAEDKDKRGQHIATLKEKRIEVKEYENEWDKTHFETNYEERIKYLTQILKLDENKIIKENNGKEEVLKVLEKHWAIFDITEQRLGRIKSNVKHTIQIEKEKDQ